MSIKLYSKFHIPIELKSEFPPDFGQGKIPKAKHLFAEDMGNQFIFQELRGNGFTVRFNQFNIRKPTSFTITSDSTIYFQISMYETTEYELAGYGNVTMLQRGYNVVTVPSFSAHFNIAEPCIFFRIEISFSNDYLKSFAAINPLVEEFLKKAENGKAAALFNVNQIASTEMMAFIDLIILHGMNPGSDPDWQNVFVCELLHHALKVKPKIKKIKANREEVARIYEVEQLLDEEETKLKSNKAIEVALQDRTIETKDGNSGTCDNYWSIRELAEYANTSSYTLNKMFRQIFGYSISNYKKEAVWQSVLQTLLLGIENMKTISSLAGYTDPPSFSRAFKKRFGNTPSEYVQELTKKLANYKKTAKRNMQ